MRRVCLPKTELRAAAPHQERANAAGVAHAQRVVVRAKARRHGARAATRQQVVQVWCRRFHAQRILPHLHARSQSVVAVRVHIGGSEQRACT